MITGTIHIHTGHLSPWLKLFWFFKSKQVQISIPQKWEDIPEKKRWKVIQALMQGASVSKAGARLLVLQAVIGLPNMLFNRIRNIDFVEKLLPYIDWIFEAPITDPFGPTIRVGATVWRLPVGEMRDMTVAHYFQVEKQWARLSNEAGQSIYLWLAAFLRAQTETLDKHYEENGTLPNVPAISLEQRANRFKKIKPEAAYYLMQYYGAQRVSIKKKYSSLFDGGGKSGDKIDWDSIPARIAESGVFGESSRSTPNPSYCLPIMGQC